MMQTVTTRYGFKKTGNYRAQFLLESLQDLDANLRKIGSGLMILRGKPEGNSKNCSRI
jgi:deoxyribodipyrimidine photo-lyase